MTHSDTVLTTALGKAARRLLPFMCLLFLVSFIDRSNVSFAALTMNKDLAFSPTIYAWGVGFFFFGYVLFEVPSNMILGRVGARRWIAAIVVAWGVASVALAWTDGARVFFGLRFLLGMAEAGLLPGFLLYMTWWFPANRRAHATALLMLAIPLSIVIGGPLSGMILSVPALDGALGFKPWQWLFAIEGVPAVLLGLAVYRLMPDHPGEARWLSAEEAAAITQALEREGRAQPDHHFGSSLRQGLVSPPVLLMSAAYFGSLLGGFGIIFWVPQIVKAFGLSTIETGFVAAIPYAAAVVAMVLLGRIGDRTGQRIRLVVLPALVGGAGLIVAGVVRDPVVSVAALTVAACGVYGLLPSFWTLPPTYLKGAAVAGGFAMVNSVGALGGFVGPYIVGWVKEETGAFGPGLIVLGVGAVANAVLVLLLSRLYARPEA